jgi:hypothetical protein
LGPAGYLTTVRPNLVMMGIWKAPRRDPSPRAFHESGFEEVSLMKNRILLWISEAWVILVTNILHISHC